MQLNHSGVLLSLAGKKRAHPLGLVPKGERCCLRAFAVSVCTQRLARQHEAAQPVLARCADEYADSLDQARAPVDRYDSRAVARLAVTQVCAQRGAAVAVASLKEVARDCGCHGNAVQGSIDISLDDARHIGARAWPWPAAAAGESLVPDGRAETHGDSHAPAIAPLLKNAVKFIKQAWRKLCVKYCVNVICEMMFLGAPKSPVEGGL